MFNFFCDLTMIDLRILVHSMSINKSFSKFYNY